MDWQRWVIVALIALAALFPLLGLAGLYFGAVRDAKTYEAAPKSQNATVPTFGEFGALVGFLHAGAKGRRNAALRDFLFIGTGLVLGAVAGIWSTVLPTSKPVASAGRAVAVVVQRDGFDWISFGVSVAATLATVFVGVAALRVSISANESQRRARTEDLERAERSGRQEIAEQFLGWVATRDRTVSMTGPNGSLLRTMPDPAVALAKQAVRTRAEVAGHEGILLLMQYMQRVSDSMKERDSADARARIEVVERVVLQYRLNDWIADPAGATPRIKKALDEYGADQQLL